MAKNAQKTNALGMNLDPESFQKEVAKAQEKTTPNADTHTYTYTHTHKKETKSKRLNGWVKQSVWDKVSEYADKHDTSVNGIINDLLDKFVEEKGL